MGVPRVMPRTIVVEGVGEIPGAMVNVGNPHFVLFVDTHDFSAQGLPWQQLGAAISTSPLFPHGTNVEFVQVLSPVEIAFRIFERGCGPTTSSGTGTCASSAAAMALRDTARELTAIAEGGPQRTVVGRPRDRDAAHRAPLKSSARGKRYSTRLPASLRNQRPHDPGNRLVCKTARSSTRRTYRRASPRPAPPRKIASKPVSRVLTELGYQPVLYPERPRRRTALLRGHGPAARRRSSLRIRRQFHRRPSFATRGGWGSAELLPHLDAAMIRANPKAFRWLQRSHLATYLSGHAVRAGHVLWPDGRCRLRTRQMVSTCQAGPHALDGHQPWTLAAADGLRMLQPGTAEGTLTGGCISIFAEALGTPYAMPPAAADAPASSSSKTSAPSPISGTACSCICATRACSSM